MVLSNLLHMQCIIFTKTSEFYLMTQCWEYILLHEYVIFRQLRSLWTSHKNNCNLFAWFWNFHVLNDVIGRVTREKQLTLQSHTLVVCRDLPSVCSWQGAKSLSFLMRYMGDGCFSWVFLGIEFHSLFQYTTHKKRTLKRHHWENDM